MHGLIEGVELDETSGDADSLQVALLNHDRLDAYGEYVHSEADSNYEINTDVIHNKKTTCCSLAEQKADEVVQQLNWFGLFSSGQTDNSQDATPRVIHGIASEADRKDKDLIHTQHVLMKKLKKTQKAFTSSG